VLPSLDVVFLNQVGSLTAIESGDNVQGLVIKRNGGVEISSGV